MPKKILFESAVNQLAAAARRRVAGAPWGRDPALSALVATLRFEHLPDGVIGVAWDSPAPGSLRFSYRDASFYVRGDTAERLAQQEQGATDDPVREHNRRFFDQRIDDIVAAAGLDARGTGR
ncbi:MAG: hypothetical protein JWM10_4335 [Myxococcaceae bacterium]|nr:hypothetical protein [Myxococcaceae bacterium]